MSKLRGKRPSAAMIVAIVALVMSMVGTGFAAKAALNKKGKNQVNNIVSNRVMGATVNAGDSCAISKQSGGITAALVGTSPGPTAFCDVTFPRAVDNCAVGATPLHPLADISGMASIRYLGGAVVRVTRVNGANNFQAAGLFSILAVCPR